ncbi:MAG: galactose-1-phosphate uridylyltransferase, partial [Thermoproteota archaeon]|nr:galactose-1-phosphate uridylyltransferase [Thermoproteota archaeon]
MGDLRKDYVLDKFVVMPEASQATTEERNSKIGDCPYCPGNESMTEPAILALVVKEGMLQRLSD